MRIDEVYFHITITPADSTESGASKHLDPRRPTSGGDDIRLGDLGSRGGRHTAGSVALGEAARSRRELGADADADAERGREAQRRVETERACMARELHDVGLHDVGPLTGP
jgi:hypothetical protein